MKKLLSKALAVVMAAALCVGMCATALAATSTSDKGSITISNLDGSVTASAYQIAYATYDDAGNFLGYAMADGTSGCTFQIASDGSYNESLLTEANLAELYAALSGASATGSATAENGTATIENLPVGSYLIVITGSESVVYSMMIGSVSYAVDDDTNDWTIDNGSINVQGSNLWAKSTTPQVEKTEQGGSIGGDDWEHGGSADLGDTLEYHITVGPIPSYLGTNPEFYVTDKISDELTITATELAAMTISVIDSEGNPVTDDYGNPIVLTKDVDYTVTAGDDVTLHGFVVDFVVNGSYTLNNYVGYSLLIDFSADVTGATSSADDDDHINDVTLTYATTSYVSGYDNDVTDEDHDYTFNALIQKVDNSDTPAALEGAEFALYTDANCSVPYTQIVDGVETEVTATSGSDGYFEFTGLEEGTYYMKETTAPAGYVLNTTVYTIVISATYDEDGTLTNYTITVSDSEGTVGSATVSESTAKIVNVSTNELPSTGGMGTTIFYIIGGVLVAGAVVVLVTRRRMSHEA